MRNILTGVTNYLLAFLIGFLLIWFFMSLILPALSLSIERLSGADETFLVTSLGMLFMSGSFLAAGDFVAKRMKSKRILHSFIVMLAFLIVGTANASKFGYFYPKYLFCTLFTVVGGYISNKSFMRIVTKYSTFLLWICVLGLAVFELFQFQAYPRYTSLLVIIIGISIFRLYVIGRYGLKIETHQAS